MAKIAELDILLRGNTKNLDGALDKAGAGVSKFKDKVVQSTNEANARLATIGNSISGGFRTALLSPIEAASSAVATLGSFLKKAFTDPIGAAKDLVGTVKGIGEGIISSVKGIGSKIVSGLKFAVDPSAWAGAIKNLASAGGSAGGVLSSLGTILGGAVATGVGAVAIAAVAGSAAVLGLGAALVYLGSKQADVIAGMHKTAQTLGFTTERFSALASTSGMDVDQFGQSTAKLQAQLVDAARNGGETAVALGRVGLNARQLVNMAPDQQLRAIAGAMGNISNQAERLRLARQLFGEERGFDFARLLGRGTQGLDEAEARARRFGLVISDSQAEMVARSNRVWSEWSLGLQGIGRSVAVMLAPAWELAGRILGAFFGKISEWVRAAVPYFEMFWGIVQTVIDDVMAFIQPALDWLDGAVNGIGSWIGKMISDVVPMVRQGWNILKSIFSVAWEFIVAGWNALVSFVAPIIQSFVTQVQGWFSALGGFLVGENITTWDQFKDRVLRILITMEFGIRNWQRVGELALNMLRLKFYEWASGLQPIAQAVQSFLNGMIDGFNTVTRGLARTIQSSINGIIDGYNALAQRVGARQISGRINVDARQLGHVNLEIANVEDRIRELRQLVSNQQGELSQDLNAFIQRRMRELTEQRQRAEQTTNNRAAMSQGIEKKDNKAIEKGSVEAFSVIVGDKGDKQFQALNRIVGEMRDANNLNRQQLRELQNRLSIAIARL